MKKILISGGLALLVIPSLCYYITKYYFYKKLTFEESMFVMFIILCSLVIFGLLFGVYNAYQVSVLHKENLILHNDNLELNKKIDNLTEKLTEFHYDNIEYHENNRDILLDLGGE